MPRRRPLASHWTLQESDFSTRGFGADPSHRILPLQTVSWSDHCLKLLFVNDTGGWCSQWWSRRVPHCRKRCWLHSRLWAPLLTTSLPSLRSCPVPRGSGRASQVKETQVEHHVRSAARKGESSTRPPAPAKAIPDYVKAKLEAHSVRGPIWQDKGPRARPLSPISARIRTRPFYPKTPRSPS